MQIALIDRQPILRTGLVELLVSRFESLTIHQSNGLDQFRRYHQHCPLDLIIVGIDDNHWGHIVDLNDIPHPCCKIIVYDSEPDIFRASKYLLAGACGYLSKRAGLDQLVECINKVIGGSIFLDDHTFKTDQKSSALLLERAVATKPLLTARQLEIATHLANGLTVNWIAEKLGKTPSTVSKTKQVVFDKLGVNNIIKLRAKLFEEL